MTVTRSPCSELQANKMEGGKNRNAKRGEAIQISFGDEKKANRGESLQEAFKKFRKDRQVSVNQALCFKY